MLDYRAEELRQAQQALAVEEQKRQGILRQIEEIEHTVNEAFKDYDALMSSDAGPMSVGSSHRFSQYIGRLRRQRQQQLKTLAHQEKQMESVRLQLQAAHVRQKSLEKLREKALQQHQAQWAAQEEKFLSEIALQRHGRQAAREM